MFEPHNAEYTHQYYMHRKAEERDFLYSMDECKLGPGTVQPHLTEVMRGVLIDWLTEVAEEYRLNTSTLFFAVHLIDHLILKFEVKKYQFQLLGSAALLLAAKMEEVEPPTLHNLVYICDGIFDVEALVLMEQKILTVLGFRLQCPSRYTFMARLSVLGRLSPRETSLASYLLELSLFVLSLNAFPASMVATAAVHLTFQMLRFQEDQSLWVPALEALSGYKEKDLANCVMQIRKIHSDIQDSSYKSTVKKYESATHFSVSQLQPLSVADIRSTLVMVDWL